MSSTEKIPTFAEWADVFLNDVASRICKPSSFEHYEDNLRKHAVPAIGSIPLNELDAPVLQKFFNAQALEGNLKTGGPLSAKSLRNLRTSISSCLSEAVIEGLIHSNPATDIIIRKAPKPKIDVMEDSGLDRLSEFISKDPNLMNIGILIAKELGIRRGEVCALQWKDFRNGYIYIRRTVKRLKCQEGDKKTELVFSSAKTPASIRTLAVSPYLNNVLEAQRNRFRAMFREPEPDDFIVFNSSGGVTDPDNLTHYFSDILQGLNLPHIKLHALRHTFASRAIEKGVDINTVSGLLGHSSPATTAQFYLKPRQQSMNAALMFLSGSSCNGPSELPNMVRNTPLVHKPTRRSTFREVAV